jgi:acetyl esterase/lipase
MNSLKSKMIYLTMKNRHLFQGRLKPEVWNDNTIIPGFRKMCEDGNRRMPLPSDLGVTSVDIHGMHAEWLTPTPATERKAILYAVGGGYVSGSCDDHRAMVAKVAAGSGIPVLMFDHRLAPEDPYPAALEDALTAYRWLLAEGFAPEDILIMGESAGGGLCLATLLALRDQGEPLPAAAVALSPWTDLTLSGESRRTMRKVCISPPGMDAVCVKAYLGSHDPCNPYISPLFGDLRGLPPLLIYAGEWDTGLDDSTRFAEEAAAAGVSVIYKGWPEMVHCFPLMAPLFPEATQALAEVCGFIRSRLLRKNELDQKIAAVL